MLKRVFLRRIHPQQIAGYTNSLEYNSDRETLSPFAEFSRGLVRTDRLALNFRVIVRVDALAFV